MPERVCVCLCLCLCLCLCVCCLSPCVECVLLCVCCVFLCAPECVRCVYRGICRGVRRTVCHGGGRGACVCRGACVLWCLYMSWCLCVWKGPKGSDLRSPPGQVWQDAHYAV